MIDKLQPLGICDLCQQPIPDHLGHFTSKGNPRLYCSRECCNTANSRNGNPTRTEKLHERVARGEWVNPATINRPTSQVLSETVSAARKREVENGTWRNPGLTPEAKAINSQPHKHSGALHGAIEKLNVGSMADLTEEERQAHRAYRRQLREERKRRGQRLVSGTLSPATGSDDAGRTGGAAEEVAGGELEEGRTRDDS